MSLVAEVRARLEARVPDLAGRTGTAADLARLQATQAWPAAPVFAHVVPGGGDALGDNDLVTGAHRQILSRLLSVVLTLRGQDPLGVRLLETVEDLIDQVIRAIAGWGPFAGGWTFNLKRWRLVSARDGAFVYEITFALGDQLRIAT